MSAEVHYWTAFGVMDISLTDCCSVALQAGRPLENNYSPINRRDGITILS